jgi:DNA polymerase-3 subunit epsilon
VQRSYDEPATPLCDVTFCVIDLETTGGSPRADAITEIGAVKVRGGEILGTFHTLVNPGQVVPGSVTALTGITEAMLAPAPPLHQVLPALDEFVGGAVLVGHNIRFDASFLDAALVAHGRPRLGIHRVDTVVLARRLLGDDDVLNCKLGTLAERFGLDHRPTHRALDDALATVDLLHLLLERAAAFGVSALDDLLSVPAMLGHPHAAKLRLTVRLPRRPGVYVFSDGQGRPLYVGRATDLRTRVRSLFASNDGRTIGPLLRTAHRLDHVVCASTLEAGVLEARLLAHLTPRYNRHGTRWRSYRYVKLTGGRVPRLAVVRSPRPDGAHYLGPLVSTAAARTIAHAIETSLLLQARPADLDAPGGPGDSAGPADLNGPTGVNGAVHPDGPDGVGGRSGSGDHRAGIGREGAEIVVQGLTSRPDLLLDPLRQHVDRLRAAGRFVEARTVREGHIALARALRRQRRFDALRRAGRMVLDLPAGADESRCRGECDVEDRSAQEPTCDRRHPCSRVELANGRLLRAWGPGGGSLGSPVKLPGNDLFGLPAVEPPPADGPLPCDIADELHHVAAWLDRHAGRVRIVEVDGEFASPLPRGSGSADRHLAVV